MIFEVIAFICLGITGFIIIPYKIHLAFKYLKVNGIIEPRNDFMSTIFLLIISMMSAGFPFFHFGTDEQLKKMAKRITKVTLLIYFGWAMTFFCSAIAGIN